MPLRFQVEAQLAHRSLCGATLMPPFRPTGCRLRHQVFGLATCRSADAT